MLYNKKIEIFKVGDYRDKGNWTIELLEEIEKNYDVAYRNAPLVFGHSQGVCEVQSFGFVDKLSIEDETLFADISFNEDLKKLIDDKKILNLSVELVTKIEEIDKDTDKRGAYLFAVAFLGASQPQVPNLNLQNFSMPLNIEKFGIIQKKEESNKMTDEEKKAFDDLKAENEALKKKLEDLAKENEEKEIAEFKATIAKVVEPAKIETQVEIFKVLSGDARADFVKNFSESTTLFKEIASGRGDGNTDDITVDDMIKAGA